MAIIVMTWDAKHCLMPQQLQR